MLFTNIRSVKLTKVSLCGLQVKYMDATCALNKMLLTDDQIEAIIRDAFRPFACTVEILPERLMRFKVRKRWTQMSIYTEPGIPIEPLREESDLRKLLGSVRLVLAKRGYELELW